MTATTQRLPSQRGQMRTLEEEQPAEYRKTLRWFAGSTLVLLIARALSALSYSQVSRF